ncbi:MAG: type III secretion inner membrane ring lipoprotein SctJ [Gammaproteobacteria bacterium]|nr:type III secretion inner membrane ring lipoprotein SctJ [Gammaproteobacteria bacterium]
MAYLFHSSLKRAVRLGLVLIVALSISACSEETLYSKLSEREANEIIALLITSNLSANKRADKGDLYSVLIPQKHFSEAVAILKRHGLPKEKYDNLGDVFAKEGFVSSPLEERARLNFALSQEIAHTISSVDGVLVARVHLAVPQKDELTDELLPASASVFVKHRSDVDLSGSVGMIKALVVNGIENLKYDNVTVALFKASGTAEAPTANLVSPTSNAGQLQLTILPELKPLLIGGVALLLCAIAASMLWPKRRLFAKPAHVEDSEDERVS